MAMIDISTTRITPTISFRENAPLQQGELFARLMLQPLPLFKHGPEDEPAPTKH